jgi:hypothetical protein
MSRSDRERTSRLAEFREATAAYEETRSKRHALWRERAMRSKDMRESDFKRAVEIKVDAAVAQTDHAKDVLKRARFSGWAKERLHNG